MKSIITAMVAFILLGASAGFAKQRTVRKVQEVNFGDMNLKGTIRNPDGAYLVQKRGIKFMPLYDVQKDMDGRIRESALYLNN
ncbi:hypothetical protein [Bdellovibrio bacteriovorus]|uniref:Uncharacterized protein n=1 Tax=Bdellovibrio bacteriovorus TaxID=959 RepID=A0A1Z3N9M3_BDEBC|nr:hypothetical protein [Bdellovibrio bacteriovorus]ASD64135.1 hypothetical protein B9G79_11435 [Bdellovibrio bacteriovorus]